MERHFERWEGSLEQWNQEIINLRKFVNGRPQHVKSFLSKEFD